LSQNSQNNIDLEKDKNDKGGSLDLPLALPHDFDMQELIHFLLFETIALWNIVLAQKQQGVISEKAAELELKDIADLEETLVMVDKTILPRSMRPGSESSGEIRPTAANLIESNQESLTTSPIPAAFAELASTLEKLSYLQRKIIVFTYAIQFLALWEGKLAQESNPLEKTQEHLDKNEEIRAILQIYQSGEIGELDDRRRHLANIISKQYDAYIALHDTIAQNEVRSLSLIDQLDQHFQAIYNAIDEALPGEPHIITREVASIWQYQRIFHDLLQKRGQIDQQFLEEEIDGNIILLGRSLNRSSTHLLGKHNSNEFLTRIQSHFLAIELLLKSPETFNLDYLLKSSTITEHMGRVARAEVTVIAPPVPGEITPAMKLHQRLERAGAYEKLDARRRAMLQTYLTTETPIPDLGKLSEVQLKSRSLLTGLLHSGMEDAFNALPETERAAYDNNPAVALQTRSRQQTQTKGEKIKDALNKYRNPESGKVEFSENHRQHRAEAVKKSNQRRGQEIRKGTYTGKPVGRPRKNTTT